MMFLDFEYNSKVILNTVTTKSKQILKRSSFYFICTEKHVFMVYKNFRLIYHFMFFVSVLG